MTAPWVPTLAGTRCTLRALGAADAPSLQRHADDPAVAYNLFDGFPQPYTPELALEWCTSKHREPMFGHTWGIQVAGEAIQALGGVGYTNEFPVGRLWRDAKLYEIGAGTSEIRRMLIGRELYAETM